jgi:ribosomal protein L11 methylase PrmA
MDESNATVDPGSYRDPLGRVHLADDRVLRLLRGRGVEEYRAASSSPTFVAATERGDVVGTTEPDDNPLAHEAGSELVVEHEAIDLISYAYEWSHSMLKDAALLTLRLSRELLDDGMILKDATPYNVQFDGVRPRFIDIGSFERLGNGEPWYGYQQFCQLFLYPLWLRSVIDVAFRPWLRGAIDGIHPDEIVRLLGRRGWRAKGFGVHGWFHARSVRRHADAEDGIRDQLRSAGFGPSVIRGQLDNLEKAVTRSTWSAATSTWSDYGDRSHYSDDDLARKEAFVSGALTPEIRRVLDLGCNDGRFSRLCVDGGRRVIAVDSDELVIDRLYRRLVDEGETRITPLVVDLSDPPPSIGWRSIERPSLVKRARPDLVLALALVHHLAITKTVPLAEFVAMLADFDARVVVEFPTAEDPMVRRLLRNKRGDLFDDYSLESFEKAADRHFVTERSEQLPSGTRHLYQLRPRR